MDRDIDAKIKIFGHPVHPMLIAYPVAFSTGTLVSYIVYGATDDRFWLRMAIALNVAAVATAVLAAVPGFLDWWLGIPSGTPAKRTGWIHMLLNWGSLAMFTVAMLMYLGKWNETGDVSATPGIVLGVIGIGLTIVAGFHGWKLVQDHHVGVKLTREQKIVDYDKEGMRRAG